MTARADWMWKGEGVWRRECCNMEMMWASGMGEVFLRARVERRRTVASRKVWAEGRGWAAIVGVQR